MRTKVKSKVRVKAYAVMVLAVENGVRRGTRKAFKYADRPTAEQIASHVEDAVLSEICEYFAFEEDE